MSRDKMSDALAAFWGSGSQTQIPQAEVDNTPEDIIEQTEFRGQPGVIRDSIEMQESNEDSGMTIKERIEKAMKERRQTVYTPTTPTQPQAPQQEIRQMQREMPQPQAPPQKSSGSFFGMAFDDNIKQQFAKERGFDQMGLGMNLDSGSPMMAPQRAPSKLDNQFMAGMGYGQGMPMGGFGMGMQQRQPQFDPRLKRRADATLIDYERNLVLDRQAKASRIGAFNMQARDVSRGRRAIEASQRKATNIRALDSGLPVYESILDPIFGGKQKKKVPKYVETYDEKGNVTGKKFAGLVDEVVSTPGAFGWGIQGAKNIGKAGANIFDFGKQKFKEYEIKDNTAKVLKKGAKNIREASTDAYRTFTDTDYRIGKEKGDPDWYKSDGVNIYETDEQAKYDPFGYTEVKPFEPFVPPKNETVIDVDFIDKNNREKKSKKEDYGDLRDLKPYPAFKERVFDEIMNSDKDEIKFEEDVI